MTGGTRSAMFAGSWYPATKQDIFRMIDGFGVEASAEKHPATMILSPHAGHRFSGPTAVRGFATVQIPDRAIVFCPKHRHVGADVAIMTAGAWEVPTGSVPIDEQLAQRVKSSSPLYVEDASAHAHEHSLEIQLPIMHYFKPQFSMVPVAVAHLAYETCCELGVRLAEVVREYGAPVLLVASSDMHHGILRETRQKDPLAVEAFLALEPRKLYETVHQNDIHMCGIVPATILMVAAKELGATKAEKIDYTDSYNASGDDSWVVGYLSAVVY